jgi:hypothetical protein
MAYKTQMTGMLGVYLVAAELSRLGFIVSPTSRSAAGADLLVTDQRCQKAWSVQVKTNKNWGKDWLVGVQGERIKSDSHMYVFVNVGNGDRAEFTVVPSKHVAKNVYLQTSPKGNKFYWFSKSNRLVNGEGWELFGDPNGSTDADDNSNTIHKGDGLKEDNSQEQDMQPEPMVIYEGRVSDGSEHYAMLSNPTANALADELAIEQARTIGLTEEQIAKYVCAPVNAEAICFSDEKK